jgi:hypothetical protein
LRSNWLFSDHCCFGVQVLREVAVEVGVLEGLCRELGLVGPGAFLGGLDRVEGVLMHAVVSALGQMVLLARVYEPIDGDDVDPKNKDDQSKNDLGGFVGLFVYLLWVQLDVGLAELVVLLVDNHMSYLRVVLFVLGGSARVAYLVHLLVYCRIEVLTVNLRQKKRCQFMRTRF